MKVYQQRGSHKFLDCFLFTIHGIDHYGDYPGCHNFTAPRFAVDLFQHFFINSFNSL
jgi:hypothetical protein